MVQKFHVNPDSGVAGSCRAKKKCRFGDIPHHETKVAAEKWFEDNQRDPFNKLSKISNKEVEADSVESLVNDVSTDDVSSSGASDKVDNEDGKSVPYDFPENAETRTFETKSGTITLMLSESLPFKDTTNEIEAWLTLKNGENVSFVKLLVRSDSYSTKVGPHLSMCDIETRVDSRGKGYARELRESIEKETGLLIYSSGSFTPEGWKAFKKHSRTIPDDHSSYEPTKPNFNSMGFVASWKERIPVNISQRIDYSDEQRDKIWEMSEKGAFRKFHEDEILWAEE